MRSVCRRPGCALLGKTRLLLHLAPYQHFQFVMIPCALQDMEAFFRRVHPLDGNEPRFHRR